MIWNENRDREFQGVLLQESWDSLPICSKVPKIPLNPQRVDAPVQAVVLCLPAASPGRSSNTWEDPWREFRSSRVEPLGGLKLRTEGVNHSWSFLLPLLNIYQYYK